MFAEDIPATLSDIADIEARLEAIERRMDNELALRLDWLERTARSLRDDLDGHLRDEYGPPRPEGR
jgi:hypothetical protein